MIVLAAISGGGSDGVPAEGSREAALTPKLVQIKFRVFSVPNLNFSFLCSRGLRRRITTVFLRHSW